MKTYVLRSAMMVCREIGCSDSAKLTSRSLPYMVPTLYGAGFGHMGLQINLSNIVFGTFKLRECQAKGLFSHIRHWAESG